MLLNVVSSRIKLLVLLNLVFFGCLFAAVLASDLLLPPTPILAASLPFPEVFGTSIPVQIVSIFLFNLIISAFIVVTLSGLAFFPLSSILLLYRAVLWGFMLHYTPTWAFLAVLPTLMLEGEAYVFAAMAGTVMGVSWLKPKWIYKADERSRLAALGEALRECRTTYVLVIILLLVASIIETATLAMMNL